MKELKPKLEKKKMGENLWHKKHKSQRKRPSHVGLHHLKLLFFKSRSEEYLKASHRLTFSVIFGPSKVDGKNVKYREGLAFGKQFLVKLNILLNTPPIHSSPRHVPRRNARVFTNTWPFKAASFIVTWSWNKLMPSHRWMDGAALRVGTPLSCLRCSSSLRCGPHPSLRSSWD